MTQAPTASSAPSRRATRSRLAYGLGLVPAAAGELVAVAVSGSRGGVEAARQHLACGGAPVPPTGPVAGRRVVVHGALGVLLGLVVWWLAWLAWLALLAIVRGPFYGFVVTGPYDDAWGGPGLAGAWAVHAWVGVATVAVVGLLVAAVAALHIRLTEHLLGGRRAPWVVPVTVLVVLAAGLVVGAWVRQI